MLIVNFQIRVTLDDTHPSGECSQGRVSEPVLCSQGVVRIKKIVMIRNLERNLNFQIKLPGIKEICQYPTKTIASVPPPLHKRR